MNRATVASSINRSGRQANNTYQPFYRTHAKGLAVCVGSSFFYETAMDTLTFYFTFFSIGSGANIVTTTAVAHVSGDVQKFFPVEHRAGQTYMPAWLDVLQRIISRVDLVGRAFDRVTICIPPKCRNIHSLTSKLLKIAEQHRYNNIVGDELLRLVRRQMLRTNRSQYPYHDLLVEITLELIALYRRLKTTTLFINVVAKSDPIVLMLWQRAEEEQKVFMCSASPVVPLICLAPTP
jgi:hypothetical protein